MRPITTPRATRLHIHQTIRDHGGRALPHPGKWLWLIPTVPGQNLVVQVFPGRKNSRIHLDRSNADTPPAAVAQWWHRDHIHPFEIDHDIPPRSLHPRGHLTGKIPTHHVPQVLHHWLGKEIAWQRRGA
jgi:hypothetical protein